MIKVSDIRSHEKMVAAFFANGGNSAGRADAKSLPASNRLREIDMAWGVLAKLGELWRSTSPYDWVAAEVPTASSIADVAAARFDPGVLAARVGDHARAVTLPLRVRTLDAIANRGISRITTLASRMGSNPKALSYSTLRPLAADGWVKIDEGRVFMVRAWRPLCTEVMTVEMKLSDWRGALGQARSQARSANRVWVVLPEKTGKTIANALPEFRENGIGLATLASDDTLRIHYGARQQSPVRWLNGHLAEFMFGQYADHRRQPAAAA